MPSSTGHGIEKYKIVFYFFQLFKAEGKFTIKHLWKRLIAFMLEGKFTDIEFTDFDIGRIQIRLT